MRDYPSRRILRPILAVALAMGVVATLSGCPNGPIGPTGLNVPGGGGASGGNFAGGTASQTGNATNSVAASLYEQLTLERINRARLKPGAEASANGISVDEGIPGQITASPKPALALNPILNSTAKAHSEDMLARDYFAHDTPTGVSPFERMAAAGYVIATAGENLAWRGTTGAVNELETVEGEHVDLFVDAGIAGRGHRVSMLNANFREVGIGIVRGFFTDTGKTYDSMMQTQDFGTMPGSGTFVLGVVYNDTNSNGQYDYGEGVGSTNVSLDNVLKNTNSAGGYSFEVKTPGTYTLRFVASNKSLAVIINSGSPNVKVDLAGSLVIVNLGLGPL